MQHELSQSYIKHYKPYFDDLAKNESENHQPLIKALSQNRYKGGGHAGGASGSLGGGSPVKSSLGTVFDPELRHSQQLSSFIKSPLFN